MFRLISNGSPVLVSLKPKEALIKYVGSLVCIFHSYSLRVKEPEIEDNETQAEERRERALAVAVDADWVVQESMKPCVRSYRLIRSPHNDIQIH